MLGMDIYGYLSLSLIHSVVCYTCDFVTCMKVNIIGDGTGEEIIIAGDRLYNLSNLDEISANLKIPQIVGKTRQLLQRKLFA